MTPIDPQILEPCHGGYFMAAAHGGKAPAPSAAEKLTAFCDNLGAPDAVGGGSLEHGSGGAYSCSFW